MAMLPRGSNGGNGNGGSNGDININMQVGGCGCDGEGGGGGGGSGGFEDAPRDGKLYGRKDGAWAEATGGGGGPAPVSAHNELSGLQGGDAAAHEFFHLTEAEWRRLPIRPTVLSPADGTENINQVPQVVGSPYAHPYDVPMYKKHIQVAADDAFANIAWELEEFSGSPVFQIPLKPDETPYLSEGQWYHVRIRYQDRLGRWSDWSPASRFKTMDAFPDGILLTPMMVIPADGGEVRSVNPILAMTSPKVAAGVANFDAADWQISANSAFETTLYEALGTPHLTLHQTEGLNLASAIGAEFYARGRQRTDAGEYTPWAVPARFALRPDYDDPVFGMRRVFSKKYNTPIVCQIDPEGNPVHIPKSYFDQHPLYAFPASEIPLGETGLTSSMAFVPPCWIKHAVYDNDDGDMVIDLWFSPTPQTGDGWILHPAFDLAQDGLYIDTCLCTRKSAANNTLCYVSAEDMAPLSLGGYASAINATISAAPGRRVWNIYERRLLLDLMTCEYCTTNHTRISAVSHAGDMNIRFKWRSFYGLVTTTRQICDGVQLGANNNGISTLSLLHPSGSSLQLGVSLTLGTGSPVSVLRGDSDIFGFDVALLGIVSENEVGASLRYFGTTADCVLYGAQHVFYVSFDPNSLGLYAFLPYGNYNEPSIVLRMSQAAG